MAILSTVRAIANSRSLDGLIWINGIEADLARDCIRNNIEHPSSGSPEACAGPFDRIPDIFRAGGCAREDSTRSVLWMSCRYRSILKRLKKAPLGLHFHERGSQVPVRRLLACISAERGETNVRNTREHPPALSRGNGGLNPPGDATHSKRLTPPSLPTPRLPVTLR